ncbi:MAG: glycerol-3-phosphate acyltransferase [Bacteroidaceae bacterium]|nr:glycerol-3-phosphate acyltransferase [Bacteroidaceae bacterium]
MGYLFAVLGGYLLGCSNMAFYLEKMTKKSIRGGGSGNLGASNTVIRLGWLAGLLVGIHDIGKALLVVYLARWLLPQWEYAAVAAGIACVLGHIFPFYLKFKGGKGFASYVGVIFALDWRIALAIIVMIFVVTLITDYIVAATMMTTISAPISLGLHQGKWILALILCIGSAVILYRHRENLVRIFVTGDEIGLRSASKGEHRVK